MKYLLSALLLCLTGALHAQVSNVVFVGTITLASGQGYSYKMQLADSNGILNGYSITDLMGTNETKTLVKGSIDAKQKQLKFRETKLVYSKSGPATELCFINATLKASNKKGTTILKGTFKGYQANGTTECASGTMMMVSAKDVMDLLMKKDVKKDTLIDRLLAPEAPEEQKPTVVYQKPDNIPESSIAKIPPGTIKEIPHSATTAQLQVWDAKTIDGDVISISQNGKPILTNYKITSIYKELSINLHESDTLKVTAISEGAEPLNTARVKIMTGNDTHYIDASTTLDKPIWIVLKKK